MKKLCVAISIILIVCAMAPCVALAQSDATHNPTYTPPHKGYRLTTVISNGSPIGVSLSGYYFGGSGITVVAEVYSSSQHNIDFYIGDANLTPAQQAEKQLLLNLFEVVHDAICRIDLCANTQYSGAGTLPTSDIFRYNSAKQGEQLQIERETYEMLQIAKQMYSETNGAFNPAVYRLVDLWGFSSRIYSNGDFGLPYDRVVTAQQFVKNGYPLPEQKYIDAFSAPAFTDFSDAAVTLTQRDGNFYVTKNVAPAVVDGVEYQQWLDLGGIAKGYVVDVIQTLFANAGFDRFYADAGSSSSAFGFDPSGGQNTVIMADSFDKNSWLYPTALLGFEVGPCSISTSGQYIRKYVTNGVEYSHIIDGATGAPAQTGIKAVMVVVPREQGLWAGKSDCLTTAITVMGLEKSIDFINGYLKQAGITVVIQYETFDGKQQVLSNLEKSQITYQGENLQNLGWSLRQENGTFVYDEKAQFSVTANVYKTLTIVLGCILGAGLIALVVYHFVRGKKSALENIQYARKDKPFKYADIGVYVAVAVCIAFLFVVFFGGGSTNWNTVQVVDVETGEQLFFYNASRDEFKINPNSANGWQIEAAHNPDGLTVTFSREIDGETHFNTVKITRGATPTVKMQDSLCGFHKDCVRNFGEVKKSGGVIVCSPNRLKITTE